MTANHKMHVGISTTGWCMRQARVEMTSNNERRILLPLFAEDKKKGMRHEAARSVSLVSMSISGWREED